MAPMRDSEIVQPTPKPQHRSERPRPMKSLTQHLWFETPQRRGYLNITDTVAQLVDQSGVQEGLCLLNAMHIPGLPP